MIKKIISIVKKASKIMLNDLDKMSIQIKGTETNIVTSSDIAVQQYLYENLLKLMPGSSFLGEENLNESNGEYCWIVDPIDGTTNYSRKIGFSAISVALSKNGEIVMGVVYNPTFDDLFYAKRGEGAFYNDKKIIVSDNTFAKALFCTALSPYKKEYAEVCRDIMFDAYQKCNDVRRMGSCALELCYIACGKVDMFFEIRICPWDYAAASLILQEAGGVIKTYPEKRLIFDKPISLIATNSEDNYDELEKIVDKYMKKIKNINL